MTACMQLVQQSINDVGGKSLLRARPTFSQSLMVTDGMSRFDYNDFISVDPRLDVN